VASVSDKRNPGRSEAEAAFDLMKAAGRFTAAAGLFGARQAISLLSSPAARTAASFDEVASVASHHLSGLTRTAFAVGASLQHGLVDAVLDATGAGSEGEQPHGSTSGLSMSLTTASRRRLTGVTTVNSGALDRPAGQTEYLSLLAGHHREAAGSRAALEGVVAGLWRCEGLSTTVAKHQHPSNSLADPDIPVSLRPVVHVGFGSGAAESAVFDAETLHRRFEAYCAAEYRDFAYEGIGAILRGYERGFFRLACNSLGFIPFDAPDAPDTAGFFAEYLAQFQPHLQRLITHGYGRIIAFSHLNIYDAISAATAFPDERVEPAVHGAAFAFAMINGEELPRILRRSAIPFDPPVRAAFQNGLIYALTFLEWFVPGLLDDWRPEGPIESDLIAHARREHRLSVERGFPLAFKLAAPRD
jgi:hypothetical protein